MAEQGKPALTRASFSTLRVLKSIPPHTKIRRAAYGIPHETPTAADRRDSKYGTQKNYRNIAFPLYKFGNTPYLCGAFRKLRFLGNSGSWETPVPVGKYDASLAQLVEHDTLNVGVLGSSPRGSTSHFRWKWLFLWHSLLFLFLFPYRLRMENQNTIDCIPTDAFAKIRFHRNLRIRDALPTRCTVCQYILLPPHLLQDMKMIPYLVSPNPEISLPGLQTRTENAVSLPGRAGRYGLPAKRMANCLKNQIP